MPETLTFPTRLIDVGIHDVDEPRLVISSESRLTHTTAQYVTLSHLWKAGNIQRLFKGNLVDHMKSLNLLQLSKTFQDAIETTRKLNIRYLWIDALCIIQDDSDDWAKEASIMQDIYAGGICNLAATVASNGVGGFFVDRNAALITPIALEIRLKDHKELYYCYRGDRIYDNVRRAPLNRRGWVLQERLLSPRTIHFSEQLYWECRELTSSEMLPLCIERVSEDSYRDGYDEHIHSKSSFSVPLRDLQDKYDLWRSVLHEFSMCNLTEEKDKLVAISGLAKKLNSLSEGDEYYGGLWKANLLLDLLWSVNNEEYDDIPVPHRPELYRGKLHKQICLSSY